MRDRIHTWMHWEYWPVQVVYFFTIWYWMYWAIRLRSVSFYRWANPGIPNGGLHGDSKYGIYNLLPAGCYPRTGLIRKDEPLHIASAMAQIACDFPLVLKPDIGCRGVGVQKVQNAEQWEAYHHQSESDYLVQEWMDWPQELSVFYVRIPGEARGMITGLTFKEFLTVEGDGHSTLLQLLQSNPRHRKQVKKLGVQMDLTEVLPAGLSKCLVPYGNHNRGTKFTDGSAWLSEPFIDRLDLILRAVPGFYYGRLDIRYNTWKDLTQGMHFSIIELNGAKSEPTHIYDPQNSFWAGQREIFRHQRIFMQIIRKNRNADYL